MQTLVKRASLTVTLLALAVTLAVACSSANDTAAGSGGATADAGVTPDTSSTGATPDASETADTGTDADTDTDASTLPDTGAPDADTSACQSPFTITSDPTAEAHATTALQALSAAATLTWSPVRGTLSSINSITIPLPDCTGDKDVYDQLFDVLSKSPDLFQIDPTEWHPNGVVKCSEILSSGFHTLVIHRTKYGPYTLQNDVFSGVADVKNGSVILRNFSGVYIPRPTQALLTTLQACADKADSALEAPLRAKPFGYQKFAPVPAPPCSFDGGGMYTSTASDSLKFDPAVALMWDETDVLKIHRQRTATLLVAPVNYTPELKNSDANCQDINNMPNIGWIRTFDSITGEVLYDKANPDPTCTVC